MTQKKIQNKILKRNQLKSLVRRLKRRNKKIVFTNGCFDILHIGHVRYLRKAKSLGDILIVGVNDDKGVRRLKGKDRPIMPEMDRAEIISSLEFVDYVVLFHEETPNNLIHAIMPDIHVKGADYRNKEIAEKKALDSYGGKLVLVNLTKGKSSTETIKKCGHSI